MFSKNIKTLAASRTDAGVHALDQKVSFELKSCELKFPLEKTKLLLNNILPKNIFINSAQKVNNNFQVRYNVIRKTYKYIIYNSPKFNILLKDFSWHIEKKLDINKINHTLDLFIGKKDFKTFCAANSSQVTTIREIFDFKIKSKDNFLIFEITGDGFLYKMIRIIMATIIDNNINHKSFSNLEKIIKSQDRSLAQKIAPACGLILAKIIY